MVLFDATTLMLIWRADAPVPSDPETGNKVDRAKERVDFLVQTLDEQKEKIIIPTPALSEILVRAGPNAEAILDIISSTSVFRPVAFDERAAVEVAAMTYQELRQKHRKDRGQETLAKLKYDRQIVAIGIVEGAHTIYSDDQGVNKLCKRGDIACVPTWELPLPPEDPQTKLDFKDSKNGDQSGSS
jgi:hypothetical protein